MTDSNASKLRVLFLGMQVNFSLPPLRTLLATGVDVCAVWLPGDESSDGMFRPLPPEPSTSELPLLTPFVQPTLLHAVWKANLPVWAVGRMTAPETLVALRELAPDVVCVACFPQRIPPEALAMPQHGFLNLHPSLLPAFRGPDPRFWQMRAGLLDSGVTVHFMNAGLDTGDIALQQRVLLRAGISGPEADVRLAETGGDLLAEAVARLAAGTLPRTPQPAAGGSYFAAPQAADFRLSAAWSARRAFIFMRGTADYGQPFVVETAVGAVVVRTAVAHRPGATLPTPFERSGRSVTIQFAGGVLECET